LEGWDGGDFVDEWACIFCLRWWFPNLCYAQLDVIAARTSFDVTSLHTY
jgi:hypothetical protein